MFFIKVKKTCFLCFFIRKAMFLSSMILIDIDNFFQQWRHYVVTVEEVINIYQNSRSKTAMESVWSVSKLSTESVGSRRELVANCVHTADATKQFRRVGVGGVYCTLKWCGKFYLLRGSSTNARVKELLLQSI